MKSYLLTSIMTIVVQWKDGQSVKFAPARDSRSGPGLDSLQIWSGPKQQNKTHLSKKFLFNFETPTTYIENPLHIYQQQTISSWKFNWISFLPNKINCSAFSWHPDSVAHSAFSVFQQVQCSPVSPGLRGELQFCHQWGEEKFSPVPALVPLPQWSRHQLRRWVITRKMKKVPDDKNNWTRW